MSTGTSGPVEFRWLHISDLHVGMADQEWLWPTLKHSFYEDMREMLDTVGPWDLVLFSGDLTQRGASEEFDRLDTILIELWEKFRSWGFEPKLIVLPGNHDILRAPSLSPELRLLRRWWAEHEIHRDFFNSATSPYRRAIESLFNQYGSWRSRRTSNIEILNGTSGILPGDQSHVVTCGSQQIGIVGLNSTWLQIDDSDYFEKLHVDTKQLLQLTQGDPHTWCQRNAFNVILTHHPLDWLHENSQSYWRSQINPPSRFDLHLFGHMHQPTATTLSTAGSRLSSSIQAASLFGLKFTKERTERIHGYSLVRLSLDKGRKELRVWPRKLRKINSGEEKLGPDLSFDLQPDNSYELLLNETKLPSVSKLAGRPVEIVTLREIVDDSPGVLRKVRYQLPFARAHANVRKIEQRRLLEAMLEARAAWLVSEWGMGDDDFLASVRQTSGDFERPAYRLDLAEYRHRDQFLAAVNEKLSCTFQQFCELISQSGDSLLLLDNFPSATVSIDQGERFSIDRDIEDLVRVIREYCPKTTVLIRSRRSPLNHKLPIIQIKSLDEADLRTYVLENERGGTEFASVDTIRTLLRHTDGIPTRIDRALRELEVITLPELVSTDFDLSVTTTQGEVTSPALAKAIGDLSASKDATLQRSFSLLKVLSLFPQGEQLHRMKRFNPIMPFFPAHATELLDQALIEVTTTQSLDAREGTPLARTLVVPRPVRECIRELTETAEVHRLNHRAAEVYFGQNWHSGVFKFSNAYKFGSPHCGSADIMNAGTIIIRLLHETIESSEMKEIERVLALAEFYLRALTDGDHFQGAAVFCDDLVPIIPSSGFDEKRAIIKGLQGRCLRMMGEHTRAKGILVEVADFPFSVFEKQSVLINLALCHQSLNEYDEAKKVAEQTVRLNRQSNAALQAKALIVELDEDDPERTEKLTRFENLARKRGAKVVANNLALLRAREIGDDPDKVREILLPVSDSGDDFYNKTRATLKLATLSLNAGEKLSDAELLHLVGAYHFLFNERMPSLFDQCHDALWRVFVNSSDATNLLTLFRYSSLYWRLSGRESKEVGYLKKIAGIVGKAISDKVSALSREAAYYLVRASSTETSSANTPKN